MQLHDLSVGEYLTDKYALWLDFRTIAENTLHGTGRRIENTSEGITLQIEKKAKSAVILKVYIYLIMDAQLNIRNGEFVKALCQVTKNGKSMTDDERISYSVVCGFDWGWKNTSSLRLS